MVTLFNIKIMKLFSTRLITFFNTNFHLNNGFKKG